MSAPPLFDRALLRQRIQRAVRQGPETFLATEATREIIERLDLIVRDFPLAADLGGSFGVIAEALANHLRVGQTIRLDRIMTTAAVVGDEEWLPLKPHTFDLIVSAGGLGFVNDLPGALIQIENALKPDGLFMATVAGADTLKELRQAFATAETECLGGVSPRVAPFVDVRDAGDLLQRAGFALPVTDSKTLTVRYDTVFDLIRDLRGMAATNILKERLKRPLRRDVALRLAEIYSEQFSDSDGRVRATFELVFLLGWSPHESQQKPLRPGSAQTRLADALGTKERIAERRKRPLEP